MSKSNISRTNLFLIELIIIIAFFIASLSIIISVFSKVNSTSIEASALNGASITMQSNAELYKIISYDELPTDTQMLYYDKNWQITSAGNEYYIITVEISLEDKDYSVITSFNQEAKFADSGKPIFTLETKKYFKK